ncbi:hypothetical protein JET76_23425 [Pseudomonas putida]|uniref:hypothetical protein n=1 Tax=Pseudomonas putida TaxID=303 RepID=UPI000DB49DBB|nr:hypothetical protein [Pseudomonas putida]MBI6944280.1 hypothetical protein [Pseudomonas putida]MBI6960404.1 hypothetical protein [Pseudomonas putida]PZQ38351.1 MAG: hypothetical protein DI560_17905 [Pseudomonas putida]
MDQFTTSALALQKNLLELRKERDRFTTQGKHEEAQRMACKIAQIEAVIAALPDAVRPPTLQ